MVNIYLEKDGKEKQKYIIVMVNYNSKENMSMEKYGMEKDIRKKGKKILKLMKVKVI